MKRSATVIAIGFAGSLIFTVGCGGSSAQQQPQQANKKAAPQLPQNKAMVSTGPGVFTLGAHKCTVTDVIEDGEDNNNQVTVKDGRNGYIYSFADTNGTTVTPELGATFAQTPGGAQGSAYAACAKGKTVLAAIAYAGIGFNFLDPDGPMDLSKHDGFSFRVRRGSDSTQRMRFKVPDIATKPEGGKCTDKCFNDFGADLVMTEEWQQFFIPFSEMKQMSGWGDPRPPAIDKTKIYSLQFQMLEKDKPFDVCVDDITFIKCDS
jgi:endoglucanase